MDSDDKILINIFIDKEFKFSQIVDPKITISDLKKIILSNTTIYSLNYIMEYQDREISGLEMLSLKQIFTKKKDEYKNGKLRFEGEYINGKRNGIGKEW